VEGIQEIQSLRARIKALTRPIHDKLDSDPLGHKLMSPEATRADYAHFLARTLGFVRPIEGRLFSHAVQGLARPFWAPQERHAVRIESDLLALGVPSAEIDGLPVMASTPEILAAGHLMGVAYVLEGSMMGGLVMAKPVRRTLDLEPHEMSFFMPSDPKSIVRRFELFAEAFDGFAKCECDERDAIEAAMETFSLIHLWFQSGRTPKLQLS